VNTAALKKRCWERLDENPLAPTTPAADVLHAVNQAYLTFVLLTLCLEKTATLALDAQKPIYGIRGQLTDYLRPLRITYERGDGHITRVRPASLRELDAIDTNWQVTHLSTNPVDGPSRYFTVGLNLMGFWRQPNAAMEAQIVYAYSPALLAADGDTPLAPEAYHESLVKFALVWLKLNEGAQELGRVTPLLGEFLADASKLAGVVRARSIAAKYDSLPFELKNYDTSRLLKGLAMKGAADAKPAAGRE
jgi:hypothetical protein